MPVARYVHRIAGREVRTRERARVRIHDPCHRGTHRGTLRDVHVARVKDDDVGRPLADPERLQCAQAPLVGRLSRNGGALIPPRRELPRRDPADKRQDDPGGDHRPAIARSEVSKTAEWTDIASRLAAVARWPPNRAQQDSRSCGDRRVHEVSSVEVRCRMSGAAVSGSLGPVRVTDSSGKPRSCSFRSSP